jgi:transposase
LKIYVYGYLNRVQSSRRLERECQRNIELVWLTGRLMPDFKTIADFRKDNGPAIRASCRQFIALCRRLDLFAHAVAATSPSLLNTSFGSRPARSWSSRSFSIAI